MSVFCEFLVFETWIFIWIKKITNHIKSLHRITQHDLLFSAWRKYSFLKFDSFMKDSISRLTPLIPTGCDLRQPLTHHLKSPDHLRICQGLRTHSIFCFPHWNTNVLLTFLSSFLLCSIDMILELNADLSFIRLVSYKWMLHQLLCCWSLAVILYQTALNKWLEFFWPAKEKRWTHR